MWKLLEKENTDTEPFLSPIEDVPEKNKRLQKHHTSKKIYVVHAVIFTANIILAAILLSRMSLLSSETSSHVFAKDAIRYKKTNFLSSAETGLTGPPSPEMDTAWDRLLDDASIRLTTNEMSQFNSSSIDLQESQGKLAWLEISHQAHCVNYIRKALYRSYYYADLAEQDWQALIMPHVDHCLNDLVQNVQCRADTTPKFFEWETERIKPTIVPNYHIARTCVDLDYFKDSLKDRVVSHSEMRRLKNPLLNA